MGPSPLDGCGAIEAYDGVGVVVLDVLFDAVPPV